MMDNDYFVIEFDSSYEFEGFMLISELMHSCHSTGDRQYVVNKIVYDALKISEIKYKVIKRMGADNSMGLST